MSRKISIDAVEAQFTELARVVEAGEEIVVTREGKPVMRMVKFDAQLEPMRQGFAKELLADWETVDWVELDKKFNQLFETDGLGVDHISEG
jgi:antitoxin (DNA-binding transcriptional repressor) of toxin-antitoxin stability system